MLIPSAYIGNAVVNNFVQVGLSFFVSNTTSYKPHFEQFLYNDTTGNRLLSAKMLYQETL